MAITQYKVVTGEDPDKLERNVLEAITATPAFIAVGDVQYDMDNRLFILTLVVGDVHTAGSAATALSLITAQDLGSLTTKVVAEGSTLYGPAQWSMDNRFYVQPMMAAGGA